MFGRYLQAPNRLKDIETNSLPSLFLAGSISEWRNKAREKLISRFNILDPTRNDWDIMTPSEEEEQIRWEKDHLKKADYVLFYFDQGSDAPISLFEYGKCLILKPDKLFVGMHLNYPKKKQIQLQTFLENPALYQQIRMDLDDLLEFVYKSQD